MPSEAPSWRRLPTVMAVLAVTLTVLLFVVLMSGLILVYRYVPIRPRLARAGVGLSALVIIVAIATAVKKRSVAGPEFTKAWRITKAWLIAGGVLAAAVVSLAAVGSGVGYVGSGTPAPADSILDPVAQAAAVLEYAQTLSYDTATHAMDEQWLDVKNTVTADTVYSPVSKDSSGTYQVRRLLPAIRVDTIIGIGPHAWVQPVIGSHRNRLTDLEGSGRGHGRIVARIWIDTAYRARGGGYARLGLPADTSYLWIDSLRTAGDTGRGRAVIISRDSGAVAPYPVIFHRYHGWSSRAWARWIFTMKDGCLCSNSCAHGWCSMGCD